jgi:hypothetical protein
MEDLELAIPNLEDEQSFERFFSEIQALAQRTRKRSPKREKIALHAYQIFLERGGLHGHDVEDWLEAERRLLLR